MEFILFINIEPTETSVSYYDLKNHNKINLEILSGQKVIKSAVAIVEQEGRDTICIGEQAIQSISFAKYWQIGFKKCLSEMNSSEWSDMATFIKGVYAEIINNNPEFNTRPHTVYIATSLSKEVFEIDKSNYLKIAGKANLPLTKVINTQRSINQNTEFIIGIDFGSSETSATLYNLKYNDTYNLDIFPGQKIIKSAVAIFEQEGTETICVGDAAIRNAPLAKVFQISFKKVPSEMNHVEKNRMVTFMKGVYAEILNLHPDFRHRSHIVYLSGSSRMMNFNENSIEYLEIAEDAGLPIAGIISSMKAISYYVNKQINLESIKNNIVIADFGGSTIDFAYYSGGHCRMTMGYLLEASGVEKALLRYTMENPSDEHMAEFVRLYGKDERTIPYSLMLYKFCEAKEDFYGKRLSAFRLFIDYTELTFSEETPIYGFSGINIPREKVIEILRIDGYISKVKNIISDFKKKIPIYDKVHYVYLTGGASKIDFTKQIFEEIFNLDNMHCLSNDNPFFAALQGIVQLAYDQYVANLKE